MNNPIHSLAPLLGRWLGIAREILALCMLIAAFSTSIAILIAQWNPLEGPAPHAQGKSSLEAVLFLRGNKLEAYSTETTRGALRAINLPSDLLSPEVFPRLLSPSSVALSVGSRTLVHDMSSGYYYEPSPESRKALVHTNRSTSMVYALKTDGTAPHLTVTSASCGLLADLPLPTTDSWYADEQLFVSLGIEQQRLIRLSPAETALALIDHTVGPRLTIIDLFQHTIQAPLVPGFSPEQVHFSPFFIDEETLLFSVLDLDHWGTVIYHINTKTFEPLTEAFTDQAYRSLTGQIILVQSFYDEKNNIPFGSTRLLESTHTFPLRQIETILAEIDHAQATNILSQFFENSLNERLRFKSRLDNSSFNEIENTEIREQLRTLWSDERSQIASTTGIFHILSAPPEGVPTLVERIPFEVHAPKTSAEFTEDIEPLLRVLELPKTLMEQYRKRSADAKAKGESYRLIDAL